MDTFLIKAIQLILAFALLVIIHEFGHFLFARIFGVKVEKFYIFFNPFRSLFKWKPKRHVGSLSRMRFLQEDAKAEYDEGIALDKAMKELEEAESELQKLQGKSGGLFSLDLKNLFSRPTVDQQKETELKTRIAKAQAELEKQLAIKATRNKAEYDVEKSQGKWKRFWSHTEYGIGWLPLGGYCKIAGMIDESMDTAQMKLEPQPWEFRTKPAWQRLLIMIAGVLFNFLLAILIYAGIVYATGEKYVTLDNAKMGLNYSPAAKEIGFQDGDIPISADGKDLNGDPAEARMDMLQAKQVKVLRNNDTVAIEIPEKFIFTLDREAKDGKSPIAFFSYRIPAQVSQVMPGEGAARADIREGDRIIAVDTVSTPDIMSFLNALEGHGNSTIDITVIRNVSQKPDTLHKAVTLNSASKMGIGLEIDPTSFYNSEEKHYSMLASVPRGVQMGTEKLTSYAKSMKYVFTKEGASSVGGFGTIGSIFPEKWNWIAFWNIAAFLSVALAFMNILPIPGLDGGHVMFLLYEMIFRRPPSQKVMEVTTTIGISILLLLLLYANGMDIIRLFK